MNNFAIFFYILLNIFLKRIDSLRIVCEYNAVYTNHGNYLLPESINSTLCTHINFNYISISNEFELMFNTENDHYLLERLVNLKNENKNLKIIISVGGWDVGSLIFSILANNVASRARFAQSVVDFIQLYNCDGVNIAWMHPSQRGGIPLDKVAYSVLLLDLKATLGQCNYSLSITGGSNPILIDAGYDAATISSAVDYINVMSYDMKGAYDGYIGHPAQLYEHKSDPTKLKLANMDSIINYWHSSGAPFHKLNLGISFHGSKFLLLHATQSLPGSPIKFNSDSVSNISETLSYSEICKLKMNSNYIKSSVDSESQAPYMFGLSNNSESLTEWIAYSDVNTMRINANYVKKKGLGGVAVWSLENDDFIGKDCKQGTFPLLNKLSSFLTEKREIVASTTTLETTTTTTTLKTTTTTTTITTTTKTTTKTIENGNFFTISGSLGECICEENIDYFRNDLTNKQSSTNEECCDQCLQNSDCKSFTFISLTQSCWLKSTQNPVKLKASSRVSCKPLIKKENLLIASTTTEKPASLINNNSFKQIQLNYIGNDIDQLLVANPDECSLLCDATFNCNGWSYNLKDNTCFLKSLMVNSTVDSSYTSGFSSFDSFICRSGSFLVPNLLSSCSSFFVCTKDKLNKFKTQIVNCPTNYLFNKFTNQCEIANKVVC